MGCAKTNVISGTLQLSAAKQHTCVDPHVIAADVNPLRRLWKTQAFHATMEP
jgi:hypothetical protein